MPSLAAARYGDAVIVRVCRLDEVAPGEMKGFEVDALTWPVLVANVAGHLYAAPSVCPHEDVSLLGGDLDGARITCPGHGYEFDLPSGRCTHDRELSLVRYQTSVRDGDLYVKII